MIKGIGNFLDFHTHILPRMDDGSSSLEMSVGMLRHSYAQGVCCVVLTPHFYASSDYPGHFLAKRERRMCELRTQYKNKLPLLIPGAEIQYFDGITGMQELPQMRIGDSDGLLIEMPFSKWTNRMIDDLLELNHRADCRVILAHIDRYLGEQKLSVVEKLAEEGILMQANASFFTGRFTCGKAFRMLDRGLIHLLGSDCHNMTGRPPNLGDACRVIEQKRGADAVRNIMQRGMRLLLKDTACR